MCGEGVLYVVKVGRRWLWYFWFGLPVMYYTLLNSTPSLFLSLPPSLLSLPPSNSMGGTITYLHTYILTYISRCMYNEQLMLNRSVHVPHWCVHIFSPSNMLKCVPTPYNNLYVWGIYMYCVDSLLPINWSSKFWNNNWPSPVFLWSLRVWYFKQLVPYNGWHALTL